MEFLDPWYLEHLICPVDRDPLEFEDGDLICPGKHRYPVVQGIPVMLVGDEEQTQWVAEATLERTREESEDPYYLDTLKLSVKEREGIRREIGNKDPAVDPVVSYIIAQTCGNGYNALVGSVSEYPIPDLPLPDGDGRVLLDVGCNWGRWSIAAAQKGYEVVGIDPSLGAVLAAQRVAIQVGITPHFVVGDGRFLPFRDEEFDVVFSYSVLQHLSKENARRCLDSMARTLRSGGDSLVQMPNFLGIRTLWNQARRGFREPVEFDVRFWSLPDLRRSFTQRIGPTVFFIDCFFGLGLQASDLGVMTGLARRATIVSEWLKVIARFIPLKLFADSLWVQSKRSLRRDLSAAPQVMDSKEARAILTVAGAPPQKSGGTAAALGFFLAGFGARWGRPVSAVGALHGICGAFILVGVGLVLLPALWVIDAIAVATKSSRLRSLALLHSDRRG